MENTVRKRPCLCVECPHCGSIFMATALKREYLDDAESNTELLHQLSDYAEKGYNASFREATEFNFKKCNC